MAAQSNDAAAQRRVLPDPAQMNFLPDGEAVVINRPLAIQYEIPGRGNTPHQIDNNVKTEDFSPSPNDGPIDTLPDPNTVHGKDIYAELIPPRPVPVVIVPKPYRTSIKRTMPITIYANGTNFGAAPGVASVLLTQFSTQLIGNDFTRYSLTLLSTNDVIGFYVAISDDPNFRSFAIWRPSSASLTLSGQNALYIAPYTSSAGTDPLTTGLITGIVETETSLDSNP